MKRAASLSFLAILTASACLMVGCGRTDVPVAYDPALDGVSPHPAKANDPTLVQMTEWFDGKAQAHGLDTSPGYSPGPAPAPASAPATTPKAPEKPDNMDTTTPPAGDNAPPPPPPPE